MNVDARPNIAMFFAGTGREKEIENMASWYFSSDRFKNARKFCYAIIGHGNPGEIAGVHISDAIGQIQTAYLAYGKKRVLLALSCSLGYGSARILAQRLNTNVIAARCSVAMFEDGSLELQPESKTLTMSQGIGKDLVRLQSRNDWIYVKKDGSMKLDSMTAGGNSPVTLNLGNAGKFFDL